MFDNDPGCVGTQGLSKPHKSFGEWIEEQNAIPATPRVLPQVVQPALGFVGNAFLGVAGSGINICSFACLALFFCVSEKTSTVMSVVLMGVNTTMGFLW